MGVGERVAWWLMFGDLRDVCELRGTMLCMNGGGAYE